MSAPSPLIPDATLVTFTIKVDGKVIAEEIEVDSVETWTCVNKLPRARLVIFDGDPSEGTFEVSSMPTFLPGKKVEIFAGYDMKNETLIFSGVVVRQGISIDQNDPSQLIVDITDEALKMTLERKNAFFEKIKDSQLIEKLLTANGIGKKVAATNTVHPEIVQFYASDWDLMLTRAEMNGMVVIAAGGEVTVEKPNTTQPPAIGVKFGETIFDLGLELDAATQLKPSAVKSYTWDPATQKIVESGPGTVTVKEAGNVSSDDLAKVFNVAKFTQQTGATLEKTSLQDWSSAELLKAKLSKIRGTVKMQGTAKIAAGKMLELAGLGDRFNGPVYVSGVHHDIRGGEWFTTAEIGLAPQWFAATAENVTAPVASGQLPAVQGLQTGIVKKVAKDPEGEFRVFVSLPLLQDAAKGVWARLGTFYGSNQFGAVFYPEVNDEVIVGFMNDDPRDAIILGSVYSKKLPPPVPPDEQNNTKKIVSRTKLEISFDDKDKILEIKTLGGHSIQLNDKTTTVSITDSNKNKITMAKGGVTIESASHLKLVAKGNVTIEAGANLGLTAKAKATMEGLQIAHTAKAQFAAKGALSEVSASGIMTVKGALVKIN
jgi:Rhs element Vgr protein